MLTIQFVCAQLLSYVQLFVTLWTVVRQASLFMRILQARILHQGIFPTQGSNPGSPALQVDSLQTEPPGNPSLNVYKVLNSLRIFASVKENKKELKLGIPWWFSG